MFYRIAEIFWEFKFHSFHSQSIRTKTKCTLWWSCFPV